MPHPEPTGNERLIQAVHLIEVAWGSAPPVPFDVGPFHIRPLDALSMAPLPGTAEVLIVDSQLVWLLNRIGHEALIQPIPTIVRLQLTATFWQPPAGFDVVGTIRRLGELADPLVFRRLFPWPDTDPLATSVGWEREFLSLLTGPGRAARRLAALGESWCW